MAEVPSVPKTLILGLASTVLIAGIAFAAQQEKSSGAATAPAQPVSPQQEQTTNRAEYSSGADEGSITTADIVRLSDADRRRVVVEGLKERLRRLDNVAVTYTMDRGLAAYNEGKVGKVVEVTVRYEMDYGKIGDSYKLICQQYLRRERIPLFESRSAYDATTGISHMLGNHRDLNDLHGRIARRHDNIVQFNFYALFLSGHVGEHMPSHLDYLLMLSKYLDVDKEPSRDGLLTARTDYTWPGGIPGQQHESRRYWIDPGKGFLITQVESRLDIKRADGGTAFKHIDAHVREVRQVDRVWLPISVLMSWRSQRTSPDRTNVSDIKVQSIHLGNLTKDDLKVVFPAGTKVIDNVRGVTYVAGQEDKTIPFHTEAHEDREENSGDTNR